MRFVLTCFVNGNQIRASDLFTWLKEAKYEARF